MIRIIGPREKRDRSAINTTSHSDSDWSSGLSPFKLGPTPLYGNFHTRIFENAWQFAKLYPEHADQDGQPTSRYWAWARTGWASTTPHRYPMGKRRRPLCSLWNGMRLGYIDARKNIYLPLYRDLVRKTYAFQKLQEIYARDGSVTLFDFDGYDHRKLGMSLHDVLNCSTRICGHAFILAMMLEHGPFFALEDLETTDITNGDAIEMPKTPLHEITVVNKKTFRGQSEYIGRTMKGIQGSPLGNPFKVKPHGPYERDESVFVMYRRWLWAEMQNPKSEALKELLRLKTLAEQGPLNLACWCAPEPCHGSVVKKAIEFITTQAG